MVEEKVELVYHICGYNHRVDYIYNNEVLLMVVEHISDIVGESSHTGSAF